MPDTKTQITPPDDTCELCAHETDQCPDCGACPLCCHCAPGEG